MGLTNLKLYNYIIQIVALGVSLNRTETDEKIIEYLDKCLEYHMWRNDETIMDS